MNLKDVLDESLSEQTKDTSEALVKHIFLADPSAHVFDNKLYIYPSHDIENDIPFDDLGSHFAMEDYHVLSQERLNGTLKDHGVALHIKNVPWALKQMWAPDAACRDGKYYLYFPAKDKNEIFRIGVAVSDHPAGPFHPEPNPIEGTYSIDPAVFNDEDGQHYMYFGGIWGGQLQYYRNNQYDPANKEPLPGERALGPRVARLATSMKSLDEPVREIQLLDEFGKPILAGDHERRFFEGPWMHKYKGKYYFSYSTGNTHFICYAVGSSPYGPFTYQGRILNPVIGWTTHHSIVEFEGKWQLFFHDSSLSKGQTHLRCLRRKELIHNEDGSIDCINP
jgi:Glycosyl hydrolases family 43